MKKIFFLIMLISIISYSKEDFLILGYDKVSSPIATGSNGEVLDDINKEVSSILIYINDDKVNFKEKDYIPIPYKNGYKYFSSELIGEKSKFDKEDTDYYDEDLDFDNFCNINRKIVVTNKPQKSKIDYKKDKCTNIKDEKSEILNYISDIDDTYYFETVGYNIDFIDASITKKITGNAKNYVENSSVSVNIDDYLSKTESDLLKKTAKDKFKNVNVMSWSDLEDYYTRLRLKDKSSEIVAVKIEENNSNYVSYIENKVIKQEQTNNSIAKIMENEVNTRYYFVSPDENYLVLDLYDEIKVYNLRSKELIGEYFFDYEKTDKVVFDKWSIRNFAKKWEKELF